MPGSESSGLPAPLGDRRLPSFQSRLTLSLLGVVLLLTGALLSAQIYSSARIIRSTVETITSAHLSHNQTLVAGYFDDAQRQLFAAEHWAEAGRLTVADTESMASLAHAAVRQYRPDLRSLSQRLSGLQRDPAAEYNGLGEHRGQPRTAGQRRLLQLA